MRTRNGNNRKRYPDNALPRNHTTIPWSIDNQICYIEGKGYGLRTIGNVAGEIEFKSAIFGTMEDLIKDHPIK